MSNNPSFDEIAPDAISPGDTHTGRGDQLQPIDTVIALHDFPGSQESHLSLTLGDTVYVLAKSATGWWDGVIFDNDDELRRGWFPNTYVRSVNYVQPVLKKMKDNKELDSITAANTAANVLIPSFTSLLQKNLLDSEKNSPSSATRKNSVVSFASSETSIPSDSKNTTQQQQQQQGLKSSDIDSLPKRPSFSQSMSQETQTSHSDMSSLQKLHSSSLTNTEELTLTSSEEAEYLSEEYRTRNNTAVTWLPRSTTSGDFVFYCQQLNIYCESLPLLSFDPLSFPPNLEFPDAENIENVLAVNLAGAQKSGHSIAPREDSITPSFDSIKRDSNSSLSTQSTNASYHNFSKPLFAMDGLFYRHGSDVTKWSILRQEIDSSLELLMKALLKPKRAMFTTHYLRLNKLVAIICASSRLDSDDYANGQFESTVRRKLRTICHTMSHLYLNCLLHLNDYENGEFSQDLVRLHSATPVQEEYNLYKTQQQSSEAIDTTTHVESDEAKSTFERIEADVSLLKKCTNSFIDIFIKLTEDKIVSSRDYDSSDISDEEGEERADVLPQTLPRFLLGEFNGGNWCNPFFVPKNNFLNASGNELKNKHHTKVLLDHQVLESVSRYSAEMIKLGEEACNILETQVPTIGGENFIEERNSQILRLIYRFLHHSSSMVDLMESFDFTVFCLVKTDEFREGKELTKINKSFNALSLEGHRHSTDLNLMFDYPIVLDFFQFKQEFHILVSHIIMATQSLSIGKVGPLYKDLDNEDLLFYDKDILKDDNEKTAMLLSTVLLGRAEKVYNQENADSEDVLSDLLQDSISACTSVVEITQKLIEERETILNYATRVMHNEFDVQLLLMERNNTLSSERSEEHSYYSGGQVSAKDVPWYLQGDYEGDLLLDVKGNIKGGTKEALIAHLTHHDMFDSQFNTAFLLTFATMMPLGELIRLLIERFGIEPPEGLGFEEYNNWIVRKQNPIRLRVMNIMKLLIEKNWSPSYFNESAIKRWLSFAESEAVQSFSIGRLLSNELKNLLAGKIYTVERQPVIRNTKPPAPLTRGSTFVKKTKLLDIDYVELARQLTLREFKMYCAISKFSCLAKVWGKKSGLNESIESITKFIKYSNQLTNFVAYMILRKSDPKKRVQVIRYFIQVAEKCRQYNNFSSMTAIISALYSSPVHRLKKTWNFASADSLTLLKNMNKLMNSSRNFNEYRDVLKFIGSEPCVPFFGVFLSDLTFVFHGNPDYLLNRTRMVNFAKRAKTCDIVSGIDRFKNAGYNFLEVVEIQKYLDTWFEKCPSIEEQYQLSLALEKKN
ncbi:Csc25 guanyl-nucleotide exchange factor [Candida orthopsilosis Co 90-125]|uniref:Csc25 guanyl-nucleotide exchange factor n=1 Tax=Candida orthopsilosis (strain 90-125) TaxID=1136231 RepID=H8X5L3_CANO9|nr:Csc25 guanyl-nucleotide exchange factor [Candida orthopsilosis Co 90-125]CCG23471.1 Csc25 guanyl-nucleotide exchange factor [Candida orthopsilosis Co 90-125]